MLPTERLDYSPIVSRTPWRLPDGARLAVWVIVNVEEWDITQPMPRTVLTPPAGGTPAPDIPNWAWHEYGTRVGWEFIGHGYTQKNIQKGDDERAAIRDTADAIARFTGKRPRGWLGPGLTETWETPDILAEEGYAYVCDWVLDDQPVTLQTRTGTIVNIPYTQECNDVAMMLIQHHAAREYADRAIDQFEQLYEDARESARVMALVVHPYIMGAPHRARHFARALEVIHGRNGVVFGTGEQILDWYLATK